MFDKNALSAQIARFCLGIVAGSTTGVVVKEVLANNLSDPEDLSRSQKLARGIGILSIAGVASAASVTYAYNQFDAVVDTANELAEVADTEVIEDSE